MLMKLHELLNLIADEEAMIELEIDIEGDIEYTYFSFWLSDYREDNSIILNYSNYNVISISFIPLDKSNANISIQIKS